MKKICSFCGNDKFRKNKVEYIYKHNGNYLVVNNVPCEECEFCGEQYFEAKTLKKIEKKYEEIYLKGRSPQQELKVPLEDF